MIRVTPGTAWPLYTTAQTRHIEDLAIRLLPVNTLMQRAGAACARLAMAVAPHAHHIWIACGPGNNGGDGLETAVQLARLGKFATVTWLGDPTHLPPDSALAHQRAVAADVQFVAGPTSDCDLCVDALLGIGGMARQPPSRMVELIEHLNGAQCPVLAIDVPSGLHSDTGAAPYRPVQASYTLSLLTLKPGLFMGAGRDASGEVWFDDLDVSGSNSPPCAKLLAVPAPPQRRHQSHKGCFGDVAVVGGAKGMSGAAILAASAALHGGAGRVFVCLLDEPVFPVDMTLPELMFRSSPALDFSGMTVVCGCGAGDSIKSQLASLITTAARLVIDADGINALVGDAQLLDSLQRRAATAAPTVLTPHPLEAARLLGCSAAQIQADRLAAAKALTEKTGCVVVLKGSGTVIADTAGQMAINPTGNGRLATAGTGDVLAGMVGASLAGGLNAFDAACHSVYRHGALADQWPAHCPLTANALARLGHGVDSGGAGRVLCAIER